MTLRVADSLCWIAMTGTILVSSCAERTTIRSIPAGAQVSVNGQDRGTTPVTLEVAQEDWKPPYRYRVELDGYETAEGELPLIFYGGRFTGMIFTAGILSFYRQSVSFRESYDIALTPSGGEPLAPSAGSARRLKTELDLLLKKGVITEEQYQRSLESLGPSQ